MTTSQGAQVGASSQSHTLTQAENYRLDAKIIKFNYLASVMQEARKDNLPARPLINDVPSYSSTVIWGSLCFKGFCCKMPGFPRLKMMFPSCHRQVNSRSRNFKPLGSPEPQHFHKYNCFSYGLTLSYEDFPVLSPYTNIYT